MVNNIKNRIEKGEILLADSQTQDDYPSLEEQGLILENEFAACIGGNWFYFKSDCNGEYLYDYETEELAEMIYDVIENPEENGLDKCEVDFYRAYIGYYYS